ncbi:hypothetical protein ACQ7HM_20390 [Williamsia sp. MIQD14]|uniref:hypothetical protein n=1 Tax=Williamsia sp. MIQD14 TaxID=3425703 RepID=UPI003DA0DB7D
MPRPRILFPAVTAGVFAGLCLTVVAPSGADVPQGATPQTGATQTGSTQVVIAPGPPVPVAPSEFGYVATHDLTVRAASTDLAGFVASIPVPEQYRAANLALADRFEATVAEALTSKGGCVQVVVNPRATDGNLFDYGFFPVAGEFCD